MSEHSSFIILRTDLKNQKFVDDKKVKESYKAAGYNIDHDEVFNKKVDEKDIPDYVYSEKLKWINHFTKEEFDKIMEVEFNSAFSALKDEFNLSQYTVRNTMEFSLCEAEEMLEAINYLLLEKYDKAVEEDVLENKYIKMLGDIYTPYYNYYLNLTGNTKDDEGNSMLSSYNQDYLEDRAILKRIKIILDAFILMSMEDHWNDLKYVLIYTVY